MPPTFRSTTYHLARSPTTISSWYRRTLPAHPFLLFGLPFLTAIVGGSFLLTPATALRYERHDRNVRSASQERAIALPGDGPDGGGVFELGDDGKPKVTKRGRRVGDVSEEYYRLAAKDIDNWENRRVKRLPGERDGKL